MLEGHDENTILGYVEGDLNAGDRAAFEALLARDESLRQLVGELIRDRETLRAVPAEEAPPYLMARVTEALERQMLIAEPAAQPRVLRFPVWARWAGAVAAMLLLSAGLLWQVDPFGWRAPPDTTVAVADPVVPEPSRGNSQDVAAKARADKLAADKLAAEQVASKAATLGGKNGQNTDAAADGSLGSAATGQPTGKGTIALAMAQDAFLRKSLDATDKKALADAVPADRDHRAEGRKQAMIATADEVAVQIELQSVSPVATRELLLAWAGDNDSGEPAGLEIVQARRASIGSGDGTRARENRDRGAEAERQGPGATGDKKRDTGDNEGAVPQPKGSAPQAAPAKPDAARPDAAAPPGAARGGAGNIKPAPDPAPAKADDARTGPKLPASPAIGADPSPAPPRAVRTDAKDAAPGPKPGVATDAQSLGGQPTSPGPGEGPNAAEKALAQDPQADADADKFGTAKDRSARHEARQEISLLVPEGKLDSLVQLIEKRTGQSLVVVRDADGAYLLSPQIANQRALKRAENAALALANQKEDAARKEAQAATPAPAADGATGPTTTSVAPATPAVIPPTVAAPPPPAPRAELPTPAAPASPLPDPAAPQAKADSAKELKETAIEKAAPRRVLVRIVIVEPARK